jgi:hypothetical protein
MNKSKNKIINKNKFFNIQKGKFNEDFFFILPTISFSPKKFLNWDMKMFSVFLAWGRYYYQINIFEIIKNTNTQLFKENMVTLLNFLKTNKLTINDIPAALDYLNKNNYLIQLIKNSNLEHPYIKALILNIFQNLPFITPLNA